MEQYSDGEYKMKDTAENELIVHHIAKFAGYMDINEAEDLESARETIAAKVGVSTMELCELMEPREDICAIANHSRALAHMLGDEIVPPNVGTGYLTRVVLQWSKRLCDNAGVDSPLDVMVRSSFWA